MITPTQAMLLKRMVFDFGDLSRRIGEAEGAGHSGEGTFIRARRETARGAIDNYIDRMTAKVEATDEAC